jgi:hypothetical protein
MGRPLNKKFFGDEAGSSFKVLAKVEGEAEGYGYIVKQTGTHTFDVMVDGTKGRCNLVVKEAGELEDGEMVVFARNTGGTVKAMKSIKGRTATLDDGTTVKWDFAAAAGGKVEAEATGDSFSLPAPVITITTQPTNRSVTAPAATTFVVAATATQGATLTYQWQVKVGAAAFANVSNGGVYTGATAATLNIANSTGLNGNQYRCVVSAAGATSVTSNAGTLTVA